MKMGVEFDYGLPKIPFENLTLILGKPKIGKNVWIGAFCLIDAKHGSLTIGKGCDISSGVQILTHSTVRRCVSERMYEEVDSAPTEIGDYCFIGTNATILMGVKIGHHSVIGAGCVVTEGGEFPAYSKIVGVPGRVVGSTKEYIDNLKK